MISLSSVRPYWRFVSQRLDAARSLFYRQPYSVLSIRSDSAGWVLDEEALALEKIATSLGYRCRVNLGLSSFARQCCHYTSQFVLQEPERFRTRQRISIDYFHGHPDGDSVFAANYVALKQCHRAISRLRVSHSLMEQVALEAGVDAAKVRRIPIGIDIARFPMASAASRADARRRFDLPATAFVVGSFQKDGAGWADGNEPKLIKGPDILIRTLTALKTTIPDFWVLLTGPARGYVRQGLENAGVPYRYFMIADYSEISRCYHALDAYLMTSRDEGGPKALLEAMASGVPIITTRVGQAIDLARTGENAWVVESEDVEGLVHGVHSAFDDEDTRTRLTAAARRTAELNSHESQRDRWADFFNGYMEA